MSSNARADFLCKICARIQKQPVSLPCLCSSVCKEHTSTHSLITCTECGQTFEVSDQGLVENKLVRNLIEKSYYLTEEERKVKSDLERSLHEMTSLLDSFKLRVAEFVVVQYDHFADLKREIDVKRESLIESIHKVSGEMMRHVEKTEASFKKHVDENLPRLDEFEPELEKESVREFFRSAELTPSSIDAFKTTKSYDVKSKELTRKLENFKYFENCLSKNRFKPDVNFKFESVAFGKLDLFCRIQKLDESENVIICSWDQNEIKVWDFGESGSLVKSLSGHTSGVCCLKMYETNKLVSAGKDKTIKVWDLGTSECLRTLNGHCSDVRCLHVLDDGNLASGSEDKCIRIWSLNNGACMCTLKGRYFSSSGKYTCV